MPNKKGISQVTELLPMIVILVVGFVLFLLIYSTFTSDSPNLVNTFTNRMLDWLLSLFA